jgi:hypothetical protein
MTSEEIKQAKRKWWNQKQKAKQRGIEFDFPFESWLQFWLDSGHWHERGISRDGYVMSRKGDTGPYRIDNVEIKKNIENLSEGNKGKKITDITRQRMCLAQQNRPPISEETRERQRQSALKRKSTPKGALDAYPIKN